MERDLIVDAEKMYRLFENESGELSFGVLCGGIAMYEVIFSLSGEEVERYRIDGKDFLDVLSLQVARHPKEFEGR